MERNQKSSKSNGVCERLCKALSSFKSKRRVSHHQHPAASNLFSTIPQPPPHKTLHVQPTKPVIHPHKPADSIPINFDFSSHPENGHVTKAAAKVEPHPPGGKKEDIPRTVSGINEMFSAYIERFRNKMENASSVDSESEVGYLDETEKRSHLDDRVNEYIHNSRIRTTSSSLGTAHSFYNKSKGK